MSISEIASAFKEAAIGVATLVAVWVAWKGLFTWRRQLKGQADFEVARTLAKTTYSLRDEFWSCRAPFLMAAEFPEGWARPDRTPPQEAEGYAYLYSTRWKSVAEALRAFDAAALEAEAMWGSDARVKTDAVRRSLQRLNVSISGLIDHIRSEGRPTDPEIQKYGRELRRATAASRETADDPLSNEMTAAVTALESFIRPHLKRQA